MIRSAKKWMAGMMVFVMVAVLTGCVSQNVGIQIKEDGSCSLDLEFTISEAVYAQYSLLAGTVGGVSGDFLKEMEGIGFSVDRQDVSGEMSYVMKRNIAFKDTQELQKFLTDEATAKEVMFGNSTPSELVQSLGTPMCSSADISKEKFIAVIQSDVVVALEEFKNLSAGTSDIAENTDMGVNSGMAGMVNMSMLKSIELKFAVTMPAAITESNGTVEGNTAVWDLNSIPPDGKIIAVTGSDLMISVDETAPVIAGVKNKGYYKKEVALTASDDVSLSKFLVDNQEHAAASPCYVSDEGAHNAVAIDANNNTAAVAFTIDMTKPVIKGAKNGKSYKKKVKLKISDKFGIKSVKVNGKKSGKKSITLKKKGKYTVKATDKAGNTATLKFSIKKR